MKDNDKNRDVCSPCEKNFEHAVDRLVHEGEAPTARQHHDKAREVEEAYSRQSADHTDK